MDSVIELLARGYTREQINAWQAAVNDPDPQPEPDPEPAAVEKKPRARRSRT